MDLRYDDRVGGFEAVGLPCGLLLLDLGEEARDGAAARAARVEAWLAEGVPAARAFAARTLLGLRNETWRGEDEPPLDAAAFANRLALEGVNAYDDGSMEVFFEDGGLFAGHAVLVSVEATGAFAGASIAG